MIVVEEMVRGLRIFPFISPRQRSSIDEEDIGPAIAVVVENGDAGASALDDVTLGLNTSVDVANGDAGLGRNIDEPRRSRMIGRSRVGLLRKSHRRKKNSYGRRTGAHRFIV